MQICIPLVRNHHEIVHFLAYAHNLISVEKTVKVQKLTSFLWFYLKNEKDNFTSDTFNSV